MIASIFGLASDLIYFERMEWALGELRDRIHHLQTQSVDYISNHESFYAVTQDWILRIRDNLTIDDAWDFFIVIPDEVEEDANFFPCLDTLLDFVHHEIHHDIFIDYHGRFLKPEHVEDYLQARERRGDNFYRY